MDIVAFSELLAFLLWYTLNLSGSWLLVIIIIIASSYIALFRTEGLLKALYRYIYYYPGHRIQAYPHTMYAHSPLPGAHSSQASFLQAHTC